MRRNACLFSVLLTVVLLTGCRTADKDQAVAFNDSTQLYSPGPAGYGTGGYEPMPNYATEALPAPQEDVTLASSSARYHTVTRHDTLYALARKYYSSERRWKEIYEANRDQLSDPNRIYVGQQLLIP